VPLDQVAQQPGRDGRRPPSQGPFWFGNMETMPFKRSRTCVEPEPEKDDEVAPEVPTSFATTGLGWSGREKDELNVVDLNEKEK